MAISFDGATKTATLSSGTTVLDVADLYSRWKDWVELGDNSKWPAAFATVGGETVDAGAGTSVPLYAFLLNGWRVRPQEADHTLAVTNGILLVAEGGDPFLDTLGDFVVRVNYQQPVQAITVGGTGDPLESDVETGITLREAVRLILSVLAGKSSGWPDGTAKVFRDVNDTKDRITATVDADGNRTAVTVDPS